MSMCIASILLAVATAVEVCLVLLCVVDWQCHRPGTGGDSQCVQWKGNYYLQKI